MINLGNWQFRWIYSICHNPIYQRKECSWDDGEGVASTDDYIAACKRLQILPTTTGVIRRNSKTFVIDHALIPDDHAEVLSINLRASKQTKQIEVAGFRGNGLSDQGAVWLLGAMPDGVKEINLSCNALAGAPGGKMKIASVLHLVAYPRARTKRYILYVPNRKNIYTLHVVEKFGEAWKMRSKVWRERGDEVQ